MTDISGVEFRPLTVPASMDAADAAEFAEYTRVRNEIARELTGRDDDTLDPTELEAALWLTREDLADVFAGTHPQVRTPRPGAIAGSLMFDWLAGRG